MFGFFVEVSSDKIVPLHTIIVIVFLACRGSVQAMRIIPAQCDTMTHLTDCFRALASPFAERKR